MVLHEAKQGLGLGVAVPNHVEEAEEHASQRPHLGRILAGGDGEGFPQRGFSTVVVVLEELGEAPVGQRDALQATILQPAGGVDPAVQVVHRVAETAGADVDVGSAATKGGHDGDVIEALSYFQTPGVVIERLLVGVRRGRLIPCLDQVVEGLVPLPALDVVVSEGLVVLGQALAEEPLQGNGHTPVHLGSPRGPEGVLERGTHQRVGEAIAPTPVSLTSRAAMAGPRA